MSPERLLVPRFCYLCGHELIEKYVAIERRSRWQCEHCGHIHYLNPRVVASVIVEYGGRTLLQRRAMEPRAGFWTFPGGFLELGETAEQGAIRETREEVGLEVALDGLHGVYSRPDVGIVLVVYRGLAGSDRAMVADGESTAVHWYALQDIPWSDLAFETTEAALRDWVSAKSR